MRAELAVLALCAAAQPAVAQMNILGPCRDGYRWIATRSSGAPVAAYATCETNQPLAIVACGVGGWPELRIAAAPGSVLPAPGEAAAGLLSIEGIGSYRLRLAAAAPVSGGNTILRVQLTAEAVEAMARGTRAVLDLAGTRVEMHLGASHDVLMLFSLQC